MSSFVVSKRAIACAGFAVVAPCTLANAAMFTFSDPSGLAAEAEFALAPSGDEIEVRLRNTSTGAPLGFDSAGLLLTGVSFILPDGVDITGGGAVIGASSFTVNFSSGSYGAGTDIGGEWGYGNGTQSGSLGNSISGNTAGVTAFGGANLDGPSNLSGPQGGLVSPLHAGDIGGLGAIQDELVAKITLSSSISDLSFLDDGVQVEFGSDAAFIYVPSPGAGGALALCGMLAMRRRRG